MLQSGQPLTDAEVRAFLQAVGEGQLSDDQKQILLVSLSHRLRETAELSRFVRAMASTVSGKYGLEAVAEAQEVVDVCGTGGSGLPRINTSTLASLLLAHCGLKIAKHGNHAAAGRYGSFNLLENLGIPAQFEPARAAQVLQDANLAFVFAPDVYPVFKHFAPVRSKIGVPTVFNALGPLLNPYQPKRQFVGTAFADLMDVIFQTGIQLGKRHFIVVRGWDGLDEISVSAPTRVLEYRDGQKQDYEINPEDFGIQALPFRAVSAANPAECLAIAQQMIAGHTPTEHFKLVAANAAFVYAKFVEALPLPDAYRKMEGLIKAGAMGEVLAKMGVESFLGINH
jgi:anthranilate phosphoribosyltransferase